MVMTRYLLLIAMLTTICHAMADNPLRIPTALVKPWGYWQENGEPGGLLVEFAQLLEREMGLPLAIEMKPYSRVIHDFKSGHADMAVLFVSPESQQFGRSLGVVVGVRIILAASPGTPAIESLDAMSGKLIGFIRGAKYGPEFDNHRGFTHIPINSMTQGVSMLKNRRIDAMASTEYALRSTLTEMGLKTTDISVIKIIGATQLDLYFSKASQNQNGIQSVSRALDQLKQTGKLEKLEKLFLPQGKQWAETKTTTREKE